MVTAKNVVRNITLEEFLKLPEIKPAREYINGKIEQKTMPQGEHSTLQMRLGTAINDYALPRQLLYAFPELRCTFAGRSLVPDLAVFTWGRIPRTEKGRIVNQFEIHPDWIIEILSPEQSPNQVVNKIIFCLKQGTRLGWLIDCKDESVMVFTPNQLPEILSGSEILPVLDMLEDWQLTVAEMFEWLNF